MARAKQLYEENGVQVSKSSIRVGDEITLSYSGLLVQCGAESVYAHIGYGENWEAKEFIPMERCNDVFKAKIKVTHPDSLNIAFKDSGDNWDNNSYLNYSFKVSEKPARTTKKASSTTEKKTASAKKSAEEKTTSKKTTKKIAAKKTKS
ncbi:MAG TPA: carbohydrate-binding protein [Acetivibrio saccincola]|uniref:carbohydrate-binding protein n=1 Tax=Acetivibrio saccincola TaxID=1677857 RepID=UPI002C96DD2B|nr:carbohydrate-binding protein [Acetivibrio saccincola]HOA97097.1 carbohydrate-binding protein [Acetivibrio saccincola]HQD27919.1 carbohydrate-binding protein [Acetivibrio saccincola]